MREILFRGKRVDNDAWVEGLLIIIWGQYHIIQTNDENTAYPIILKTIFGFVYNLIYDGLGRHYCSRDIEVISNIYDNPELVGDENNV